MSDYRKHIEQLRGLNALSIDDQSLFQETVGAIMTETFLFRGIERDKKRFRFAITNRELIEAYFSLAGIHLRADESLGVIGWETGGAARLALKLDETLTLLVFRVLYEEKRSEISLAEHPSIRQNDFQIKYKAVTERTLGKSRTAEILRFFQSVKLISVMGEETNPETVIVLFPTLAFALDGVAIDEIHDRLRNLRTDQVSDDEGPEKTPEGPNAPAQ